MNAITPADTISPETLEHVLGTGDISKLTVPQRVEFYKAACRSLNLNPLTRPIRFLVFQGQTQAYFTRDGTDQLRRNNKLSLNVVDKHEDDGIYIVTVRAKTPEGREDEDLGAVPVAGLKGDAKANALMKCTTKAKRRVTLSICGLGWPTEDELDTMRGAKTFDAEDHVPLTSARAEVEQPAASRREAINASVPLTNAPEVKRMTLREWMDDFERRCEAAQTEDEANAILKEEQVLRLDDPELRINESARARALRIRREMVARIWPQPLEDEDELPEVEIAGAEKMAAG